MTSDECGEGLVEGLVQSDQPAFCDIEIVDGKKLDGLFSIVDILWLRLLRTILVHDEQISLRVR